MPLSKILFIAVSIFVIANVNILFAADSVAPSSGINMYESLLDAIKMDSEKEVIQFIAFGAYIDHRYEGEKTPLMLASSMGSIGAVRALLELGANPHLKSNEGMTAIDYAHKNNYRFITAVLKVKNDTITNKIQPEDIVTVEPDVEIVEVPAKADTDTIEQSSTE